MPWKKDAAGKLAEGADGNPIWIKDDNTEQPVPSISALNLEAKNNREKAEKLERDLAAFNGLDPVKAREAIAKLKDVDLSKLVSQDKLEEARALVAQQFTDEINKLKGDLDTARKQNADNMIDMQFAASGFVKDKIAIPGSMFKDSFRKHFTMDEHGKLVAKDANGNVIYSTNGSGGPASFDEAIAKIIDVHPDRNAILRAPNHSGTGNNGNGGQTVDNARRVLRTDFDKMSPGEQAQIGQQAGKKEVVIVDSL